MRPRFGPRPGVRPVTFGPTPKPKARARRNIERVLARKQTLGQVAVARLDEMLNLAVGKPAPEIEGVDVDGKPLRLSDYKGKVVVLVFWGSWCGPCMELVPNERDLAERLKGQPFALLGVDCEANKDQARGAMTRERMTWPNWYDGAPARGRSPGATESKATRRSSSSMPRGSSEVGVPCSFTKPSTSSWNR